VYSSWTVSFVFLNEFVFGYLDNVFEIRCIWLFNFHTLYKFLLLVGWFVRGTLYLMEEWPSFFIFYIITFYNIRFLHLYLSNCKVIHFYVTLWYYYSIFIHCTNSFFWLVDLYHVTRGSDVQPWRRQYRGVKAVVKILYNIRFLHLYLSNRPL